MAKQLNVEQLTDTGSVLVGSLHGSPVLVGREPEDGITVQSTTVSRNHGEFVNFRNNWFYRDLGSTNGSWLNGAPVARGEVRLVRAGDVIQMADTAIKLSSDRDHNVYSVGDVPDVHSRSVIVMQGDEFVDEFPVPEYGRALVIGGSQADLSIQGMVDEYPALVVERRGNDVVVFGMSQDYGISIDGKPIEATSPLSDGCIVRVADYSVFYNFPGHAKRTNNDASRLKLDPIMEPAHLTRSSSAEEYDPRETERVTASRLYPQSLSLGSEGARSSHWLNEEAGAQSSSLSRNQGQYFGAGQGDLGQPESTIAVDPAEVQRQIAGYDRHPSMRYSEMDSNLENDYQFRSLEDRIVMLVGLFLLLALMGSVVWLFLLR